MTSLFNEYAVHHSSSDGVLVQLPGNGGFGRMTKETLGGDALAERLLLSFAGRSHVPALMQRGRDAQGYRLLTVNILEVWSELYSYPPAVRYVLSQLNRKHLLVGLGTTTAARLIKSTEKGLLFHIPPNIAAVAAWEGLPGVPDSRTGRARRRHGAIVSDSRRRLAEATVGRSTSSEHVDTNRATPMKRDNAKNEDVTYDENDSDSGVKVSEAGLPKSDRCNTPLDRKDARDTRTTHNSAEAQSDEHTIYEDENDADDDDDDRSSHASAADVDSPHADSGVFSHDTLYLNAHRAKDLGAIEVRVLDYNVASHAASVTARVDTVERTPMDTTVAVAALSGLRVGCYVNARVLLSATEEECAVVEVVVEGNHGIVAMPASVDGPHSGLANVSAPATGPDVVCSVIGYYIYDWNKLNRVGLNALGQQAAETSSSANASLSGTLTAQQQQQQQQKKNRKKNGYSSNSANTTRSDNDGNNNSISPNIAVKKDDVQLSASTVQRGGGLTLTQPPVVGSTLRLLVEFVPEHTILQHTLPFVVLSHRSRSSFGQLPAVRMSARACSFVNLPSRNFASSITTNRQLTHPRQKLDSCLAALPALSSSHLGVTSQVGSATCEDEGEGLIGYLPWRDKRQHSRNTDEDENDESNDSAAGQSSRVRRRKLEEAIDAYERAADTVVPHSPAEFQRLLLAQPNSSYIWTQYIAYHVGLQQYEDARQVAEKALHTIGAREEAERLNVWVAYLNLENLHGTTESLAAVFSRALRQQLHPLALHERLADIYSSSHKSAQLLALCRSMTSKFRSERRTWERLGTVLADQDRRDQLKRVLKEMSSALRREEATRAVVHIAVHEYKRGSVENGRALLEGVLLKSPQQSDVWSIAIEQETALLRRRAPESSVAQVRQLFERAVTMNLKAKVMQQFLTRFLAFERAHGSPADVDKVKERARAYVQAKIHRTTEAGMA